MSEDTGHLSSKTCWIISDGKAGVETQCLAIAEQLGLNFELKRVAPRRPWRWFAPRGPVDPAERFASPGSPFAPPFPDIVIAGGRMTVPYVRALKRRAGSATFTVFLQDPRTGPDTADLIWVPEHDTRRDANVFTTLTTPHRLTLERLAERRAHLPAFMAATAGPRLAVLLGGDSRSHSFLQDDQARLLEALTQMAPHFAGIYVTASRRTPDALYKALEAFMAEKKGLFWDGQGANPLHDFIAHADHLVVTADSANMVCEACVSGRPVHVFHPSGGSRKFDRLHRALEAYGATRPLTGTQATTENWSYAPLSATEVIAEEISSRWVLHQQATP